MSDNKVVDKLEGIFCESVGYFTFEENSEEFVLRRARELENESKLCRLAMNDIFLRVIIPAYKDIEGLPEYHGVMGADSLDINFELGDRVVMLSANLNKERSHVYWQDDSVEFPSENHYGGDYNFNKDNIFNWLKWLVSGEDRPQNEK